MRNLLDNLGLAARFAFLPLIGGIAVAPTTATAMPAVAHAPLIQAAMSGVQKVDQPGNSVNGRRIFLRENCYICHGGRAGGGMCLNLRDDRPSPADVAVVVDKGDPRGMPSFKQFLEDQDVRDLGAYFTSLRTAAEPTFTHWWETTPTQ
jgi:mono/diheme cytochrome c family protein